MRKLFGGTLCLAGVVVFFTAPASHGFETLCNDKIDNDKDGLVDCDDPDCACSGQKEICDNGIDDDGDKLVDCDDPDCDGVCQKVSLCWMTGGGVKFDSISRIWAAEVKDNHASTRDNGPSDSVGGNIYPSCSEFPGNGGNWNHQDKNNNLHLLGTDNTVVRCGNVDGIPPGTTSPVCGVNFIEWTGKGTVQGTGGNKFGPVDVTYFGRVEDRNEPGNEQAANDGAHVDRYFLRVVDLAGNLLILVDADGVDDGAVDPLTITGGNFQIHCSSCASGTPGGGEVGERFDPSLFTIFLRGDSNTDGSVDISDPIYTLSYLFRDGKELRCADAADANDDGQVDIADPVMELTSLFADGVSKPYPQAGYDNTIDGLGCGLNNY